MQEENALIGVQIAAFYPDISLSTLGGFVGSPLSQLFTVANRVWSLGASASETLFERRRPHGRGGGGAGHLRSERSPTTGRRCCPRSSRWRTSCRRCASWSSRRGRRPLPSPRPSRRCDGYVEPVSRRHRRLHQRDHRTGAAAGGPAGGAGGAAEPAGGERHAGEALGGGWKTADLPDKDKLQKWRSMLKTSPALRAGEVDRNNLARWSGRGRGAFAPRVRADRVGT